MDAGNRVKAVPPGSAADRAGLKPGDRLAKLNGYSVASFADATYALHKAPAKGSIPVSWVRDGKEQSATLEVADGLAQDEPDVAAVDARHPPVGAVQRRRPDRGREEGARARRRSAPRSARTTTVHATLKAAGRARAATWSIGFDGKSVDGTIRDLLGFVRRNYLVGDEITINVIRDGKPLD